METATQETPAKERKPRKAYDPGTPGEILPLGESHFAVESFRNSGEFYSVDLEHGTCTCPNFTYRVAPALERGENPKVDKHIEAAEAFAAAPSPLPSAEAAPVDPDDDGFPREGDLTPLSDLLPEAAKRLLRPAPDPVHAAQLEDGWADDTFGVYA